jgi:hypothetical protein
MVSEWIAQRVWPGPSGDPIAFLQEMPDRKPVDPRSQISIEGCLMWNAGRISSNAVRGEFGRVFFWGFTGGREQKETAWTHFARFKSVSPCNSGLCAAAIVIPCNANSPGEMIGMRTEKKRDGRRRWGVERDGAKKRWEGRERSGRNLAMS